MNNVFTKSKILALTFVLASALTACNTMEGAGKDIKAGGSKIEDSADKNNNYESRSNQ
jgi:predicted small secreted protein